MIHVPTSVSSQPGAGFACMAAAVVVLGGCAGNPSPDSAAPAPGRDLGGYLDMEVATVAVDVNHGQPLALLHAGWENVLPVWIGEPEALAIARARAGIPLARPLTHDLFVDVIEELGGELEEILVYDIRDNVYLGILRVRTGGSLRELDSRPSDALALAVRTGARIRVAPHLVEGAPDVDFISMEGERPIVRVRGVTATRATRGARAAADGPAGAVVLHVDGVTTARAVHPGDRIVAVDGRPVRSPRGFLDLVLDGSDGAAPTLTLIRDGREVEVPLPPREGPTLRSNRGGSLDAPPRWL